MAYTINDKKRFLEVLREKKGLVTKACEAFGIPYSTFKGWKRDPEFLAALEEVDESSLDHVESKLYDRIEKGDTTAIIFYLKTKGKKRGYTEKALPEESKPVQVDESKELSKAAQKKVRAKKDYIIKLLKKEGKYTAELSMQVTLAAQLIIKAEQLQEEMSSPGYQQVLVEYSREGNRREQINPKEKLYMDLSGQIQRALRALGMNTDAKERKTDSDSFGDFMEQFRER